MICDILATVLFNKSRKRNYVGNPHIIADVRKHETDIERKCYEDGGGTKAKSTSEEQA